MEHQMKLNPSFFQDSERQFYTALQSDLYRIIRYDVDRIKKEGIDCAEQQLEYLMTYMLARIIYFSNGWVLAPSGACNRCVAARTIAHMLDCYQVES